LGIEIRDSLTTGGFHDDERQLDLAPVMQQLEIRRSR
jgi:hypothetical protein